MARVLIADDAPGDRFLLSLLLREGIGVETVCVPSGKAALVALDEGLIDVVVTDLMMPDISGLDLVQAVHERMPGTPVVLVTGHGSEDVAADALRRGAASYVPKRYLERDLVEVVSGLLAVSLPPADLTGFLDFADEIESIYVLGNSSEFIYPLAQHLRAQILGMGVCDRTVAMQVGVALVEAMTNALVHGNLELDPRLRDAGLADYLRAMKQRAAIPPYCERRIRVQARVSRVEGVYVVRDEGKGFVPADVPDPREFGNMERTSGRGLLLIRSFMDDVRHNERGNEITMVKRTTSGDEPAREQGLCDPAEQSPA